MKKKSETKELECMLIDMTQVTILKDDIHNYFWQKVILVI